MNFIRVQLRLLSKTFRLAELDLAQCHSPIFIVPDEDVTVNGQPRSSDDGKQPHQAVRLDI